MGDVATQDAIFNDVAERFATVVRFLLIALDVVQSPYNAIIYSLRRVYMASFGQSLLTHHFKGHTQVYTSLPYLVNASLSSSHRLGIHSNLVGQRNPSALCVADTWSSRVIQK